MWLFETFKQWLMVFSAHRICIYHRAILFANACNGVGLKQENFDVDGLLQ